MKPTKFKISSAPCLLVISLITILTGVSLHKSWNVNLNSMDYLREASTSYPDGTGMSATLADHPRFILWNAVASVREGNSQHAHSLLQPLIDTGDQYALQINAWAYETEGDYANAIHVQTQLGNDKELLRICRTAQELK